MDFHTDLRKRFPSAIKDSCSKGACKLKLSSLSSHRMTILDVDQYLKVCPHKGKLCDYFLFLKENLIAVAVEMKGGKIRAHIAVEQISNGAKEIEKIVGSYPVLKFFPVLLYGKFKNAAELKILKRKIKFKGKDYPIIKARCGHPLQSIIGDL